MPPANKFCHSAVRTERRLLIYSKCQKCCEGKLVSEIDGSLKDWEEGHQCNKKPMAVSDRHSGAETG
jgi:hypothetical protein